MIARIWRGAVAQADGEAFAGEDPDVAVFYPEDDRFLIERDEFVSHYQVDRHAQP